MIITVCWPFINVRSVCLQLLFYQSLLDSYRNIHPMTFYNKHDSNASSVIESRYN